MRRLALLVAIACAAACGDAASDAPQERREGPPRVAVVNHPLATFVSRLAGDAVEVVFPVPPDEDPAYWRPTDDDVAAYQSADLVLLNGAGYAQWVARVSLPRSRMVDTSRAYAERLLPRDDVVTHAHGPEGAHAHGDLAFTTWLDPDLARLQAAAVAEALARVTTVDDASVASLNAELDALTALCDEIRDAAEGRPLLASHPVYDYLARRCSLDLESLHWEPDADPDAEQWLAFEARLRERPATLMGWEDERCDRPASASECSECRSSSSGLAATRLPRATC